MKFKVLFVILVLSIAGCDSPVVRDLLSEPPIDIGKKLTGEEIQSTLTGNSVVADWSNLGPLTVHFPSVGEMRGMRSNHYRDAGTWLVENDNFCGDWNNWWGTLERCWEIYLSGSRLTLKRADRDVQETIEFVKGNPAEL